MATAKLHMHTAYIHTYTTSLCVLSYTGARAHTHIHTYTHTSQLDLLAATSADRPSQPSKVPASPRPPSAQRNHPQDLTSSHRNIVTDFSFASQTQPVVLSTSTPGAGSNSAMSSPQSSFTLRSTMGDSTSSLRLSSPRCVCVCMCVYVCVHVHNSL